VTGSRQPATLGRALETGAFDVVQATWNLLEPSAGPAVAISHAAGIGVIVKEPLANGRLTARGPISQLAAASEHIAATSDALALAAALSQPWADVVLSGPAAPSAIRSNLAALALKPPAELLNELEGLREDSTAYWHTVRNSHGIDLPIGSMTNKSQNRRPDEPTDIHRFRSCSRCGHSMTSSRKMTSDVARAHRSQTTPATSPPLVVSGLFSP
jgi:hypothetical protein